MAAAAVTSKSATILRHIPSQYVESEGMTWKRIKYDGIGNKMASSLTGDFMYYTVKKDCPEKYKDLAGYTFKSLGCEYGVATLEVPTSPEERMVVHQISRWKTKGEGLNFAKVTHCEEHTVCLYLYGKTFLKIERVSEEGAIKILIPHDSERRAEEMRKKAAEALILPAPALQPPEDGVARPSAANAHPVIAISQAAENQPIVSVSEPSSSVAEEKRSSGSCSLNWKIAATLIVGIAAVLYYKSATTTNPSS